MMDSSDPNGSIPESMSAVSDRVAKWKRQYQILLDRSTPHVLYRWLGFVGLVALFMLRILLAQGVSLISHLGWKYVLMICLFSGISVRNPFNLKDYRCSIMTLYPIFF
jgi:hypothetical protein